MPSLFPVLLQRTAKGGGVSPGRSRSGLAFSACAFVGEGGKLVASERVQLLPAGEFRSLDGRPQEVAAWFIDGKIAGTLIAAAAARATPYVLDYHHQSLLAASADLKAPAAGWFKTLDWVEGVGLFATDVQWTETARQMLEADELRYVSPVFAWDRDSGRVTHLINAALTNNPGLDGMAAVTDRVAAELAAAGLDFNSLECCAMDDLIDRLRYFLNLPITATAEECAAELQKLIDQIGALGATDTAVASLTLPGRLLAALARTPDTSEYVPMAVHAALQGELAAALATIDDGKRAELMAAALADGRILPATETYWRGQPLAALSAYLDIAQPVAALTGMQSGGQAPGAIGGVDASDPMALARAAQDFQEAEAAAGRHISIAQAVAHIFHR